jgi:hypothetical protein
MQCPKCNAAEMYGSEEDKARALSFSVFALVLLGAGAAMHLSHVQIWPWWLYGIGGFVLFQAMLKWLWSTHRYCPKCLYTTSVWPWTQGQVESRMSKVGSEPVPTASGSAAPPLVAVKGRFAGETIEQALYRFESQCSEENVDGVTVQERAERSDGVLVRYDVSWKHSVFDEQGYDSYVSWALLAPADPGAGDPADARFRVVSATAEHHNL